MYLKQELKRNEESGIKMIKLIDTHKRKVNYLNNKLSSRNTESDFKIKLNEKDEEIKFLNNYVKTLKNEVDSK